MSLNYFKTEKAKLENLKADFSAPARIVASVVKDIVGKEHNLILFSDPDLTANFSIYLERIVNIKTYQLNLDRVNDLFANGAATGKDVIEGQTLLYNEEAAIIENEARFLVAGLDASSLITAKPGTVWLICEVPEDQISKFQIGNTCKIKFQSYEEETFKGQIQDIGETVDNVTRMVKLRILINNPQGKLKSGMFATVFFGISEGTFLNVDKRAVITVQGKDFVFVKVDKYIFERREVITGQSISNRVIIYDGVKEGEEVVLEGAMQLKGLSFGF
jgi:multidrug efflux pump subunit AcrA (membrane-fusion protein)